MRRAKERGITVTNTPGVLTDTVAEHAVALICAVATRIVEADSFMRAGKFTGWEPEMFLGIDLRGKTLGILGAGRIGTRVAEIATGFGMKIIYHDVRNNETLERSTHADYCGAPEDLLRRADVVSVHLPLNDATHHFLNGTRLAYMKQTAILVNTSRGAVIDEDALTALLREGKIFGAGLDVFEHEPETSRALRKTAECDSDAAHRLRERLNPQPHGGDCREQYYRRPPRCRTPQSGVARTTADPPHRRRAGVY